MSMHIKPEPEQMRGLLQLSDGRWRISWKFQGKYHRRIMPTKKVALESLRSIRTKITEGRYLDKLKVRKVFFNAAVEKFLQHSHENLREVTATADERIAKIWLASPCFKSKTLDQINVSDVERFIQSRVNQKSLQRNRAYGRPISKREIDLELSRLKRLFSLCVGWEMCDKNPAKLVKFFNDNNTRRRYLTDEEEERLMAAAAEIGRHAELAGAPPRGAARDLGRIIRFALNTGMRRGEILSLRWRDVDLTQAIAILPGRQTKGKRDRMIHLNQRAITVLRELPRPIDSAALVFGNSLGKDQTNLERNWRKALLLSGLENFRFHDLRHTFASRLVSSGVDLAVIRDLLGHQSFDVTLRYTHLAPGRMKDAVAILDQPKSKDLPKVAGGAP
jgi:integrase